MTNFKKRKRLNPVQLKPSYVKLEETKKCEQGKLKSGYVELDGTNNFICIKPSI